MTDTAMFGAPVRVIPAGRRLAMRMDAGSIIFRRWAGCWIDFIALVLVAAPFLLLGVGSASRAGAAMVLALLAVLAYFPVTEGIWGRSLGKLLTGTIVVNAEGDPPGVLRAIVRTLFRLIEVNPFLVGGLPAGLFVINTKHCQRLGDMVAGTYVVRSDDLKRTKAASPAADVFD
jgi:uncharacterized RDD family membrane protein YckC